MFLNLGENWLLRNKESLGDGRELMGTSEFQWSCPTCRHLCPEHRVPCLYQPTASFRSITTYFTTQSAQIITLAPLYSTKRDMQMLLEEIWISLTPLELPSHSTKSNYLRPWLTAKAFRRGICQIQVHWRIRCDDDLRLGVSLTVLTSESNHLMCPLSLS